MRNPDKADIHYPFERTVGLPINSFYRPYTYGPFKRVVSIGLNRTFLETSVVHKKN